MSVARMLRELSARELVEWEEYYKLEPWGEERADLRNGMLAAPLINLWRRRGGRVYKPSQWLMRFDRAQEQSPEEMKRKLQLFTVHMRAVMESRRVPRQAGNPDNGNGE